MNALITPHMKVDEALRRYPQVLAVFLDYGFKPLRNPLLRRTFAPLMTIQGAARRHHWEPERLERFLAELNACAAEEAAALLETADALAAPLHDLRDIEARRLEGIVVTPSLVTIENRGQDPVEAMVRILSVAQQLAPEQRLEAICERPPALLYPKLKALGFLHETGPLPDGFYRVTVRR